MDSRDDRVARICREWEDSWQRGDNRTPEDLCRDDPDLVEAVRSAIREMTLVKPPSLDASSITQTLTGTNPSEPPVTIVPASPVPTEPTGPSRPLPAAAQPVIQPTHVPYALPAIPVAQSAAMAQLQGLPEYQVNGILGRGGMGIVYHAVDTQLQRDVALKMMLPRLAADPQAKARFLREARSQAKVEHDHVAAIFRVSEHNGVPFLTMPLLKGQTLAAALHQDSRPTVREWVRIGREIAEGLAAAHERGLVHRDVKPGNIWLEGARRKVKILDFGLARAASEGPELPVSGGGPAVDSTEQLSVAGVVVGTPAYMAPEQAWGRPADSRADLFSLGIVLYQMATGRLPFNGPDGPTILRQVTTLEPIPPRDLVPDLAGPLDDLIVRLLAKAPEGRPASAAAVADELRQVELSLNATLAVQVIDPAAYPPAGGPDPWSDINDPVVEAPASSIHTPAVSKETRSRRVLLFWGVFGLVVLLCGGTLASVLYLSASPRGTITVHSEDPAIQVVIKKDGQIVRDRTTDREFVLPPGEYVMEIAEGRPGMKVRPDRVSLKDGTRESVTVTVAVDRPKPRPKPQPFSPPLKNTLGGPLGHMGAVFNVAFSESGQTLMSSGGDGVRIWDAGTAQVRQAIRMNVVLDTGYASTLSPDGRFALWAPLPTNTPKGLPSPIVTWSTADGAPRGSLEGHTRALYQIAFAPDGNTLVSASLDGTVRIWDFQNRRQIASFIPPNSGFIRAVDCSSRGVVAVGSGAGNGATTSLYDLTGAPIRTFYQQSGPLCFSRDGCLLAGTAWRAGVVTVWDAATGDELDSWTAHPGTQANGVVFSADGRVLVSSGADGTLKFWEVPGHKELGSIRGHDGPAYALALSPDGNTLASTGPDDHLIKLWDVSGLGKLVGSR